MVSSFPLPTAYTLSPPPIHSNPLYPPPFLFENGNHQVPADTVNLSPPLYPLFLQYLLLTYQKREVVGMRNHTR